MMSQRMLVAVAIVASACARETTPAPSSDEGIVTIGRSYLHPGPGAPYETNFRNPYEGNALAKMQGERLYIWYNCGGCHGNKGGGGMGPPLRDQAWIYGGDPISIYKSTMEGRPKGMPTWYGRLADDDAWKIVAYVQSLSKAPPTQGATPSPTQ